jgi:hypothetical protein
MSIRQKRAVIDRPYRRRKGHKAMIQFLIQHQFWVAVGLYWIFSAAISAMPEPKANDVAGYLWLYRFLHTTAGNLTTAFGGKIPGLRPFIPPVLLLPLLLPATACAAIYTVHPGALNPTDSAAYDTLLVAESTIQHAQEDYQAGRFAGTKDAINKLVQSYNVARDAWLTYRNAVATNTPTDEYFRQLNQNLVDLTNAIRDLTGKEAKQ